MSFDKKETEKEDFVLFGDLLNKLTEEYNLSDNPSKAKLKDLLEAMLKIIEGDENEDND